MIIALIGGLGRRPIYWYDIVFFALAGVIVFPDKILLWISDMRGKIVRWWHYVLVELLGICCIIIATVLLLPIFSTIKRYPLKWWHPLVWIGILSAPRIGVWLVSKLFDFDDWGD